MKTELPVTDSIEELARFWQTHDLSEFADQLEEVAPPVFARRDEVTVAVPLTSPERQSLQRIAASQGLAEGTLIHRWVKEKLQHP